MAKHGELLLLFILFISAVGCYCGQAAKGESKLIIGRNLKVGRLDMDDKSTPLLEAEMVDDSTNDLTLFGDVIPATEVNSNQDDCIGCLIDNNFDNYLDYSNNGFITAEQVGLDLELELERHSSHMLNINELREILMNSEEHRRQEICANQYCMDDDDCFDICGSCDDVNVDDNRDGYGFCKLVLPAPTPASTPLPTPTPTPTSGETVLTRGVDDPTETTEATETTETTEEVDPNTNCCSLV